MSKLLIGFFAILALLILGGGYWVVTQTMIGVKPSVGDCETAPAVSVAAVNAINRGTNVTTTEYARINGQYVGAIPSSFQRGDEVELLVSASNYIDVKIAPFVVDCGAKTVPVDIYATSTNAFRLFNTNNDLLEDATAGTGVNQSASAATISLNAWIDSTSEESTGDLVIVVEASNTTQVDDIVLSGFDGSTPTDVPEFYSINSAGAIAKAYKIFAVVDGASVQGTIALSPESSATMNNTIVYVTAYSEQAFVDIDGTYKVGIEDSNGNVKYEDTWDYDFHIFSY